jgi:hypothetical protein
MSASGNKPFASDPIADASEVPNDRSGHMYATRSGESPCGILPLKLASRRRNSKNLSITEISRRRVIQATSAVAASWPVGAHTAATGRIVNGSLAEYHVPVNADVSVLDVSVIGIPDLRFNPIGSRGIGEIGITGTAAGVANAIYNTMDKRV